MPCITYDKPQTNLNKSSEAYLTLKTINTLLGKEVLFVEEHEYYRRDWLFKKKHTNFITFIGMQGIMNINK